MHCFVACIQLPVSNCIFYSLYGKPVVRTTEPGRWTLQSMNLGLNSSPVLKTGSMHAGRSDGPGHRSTHLPLEFPMRAQAHTISWPISETLIDLTARYDRSQTNRRDGRTAVCECRNFHAFSVARYAGRTGHRHVRRAARPGFVLSQRRTPRAGTSSRNVPSDT